MNRLRKAVLLGAALALSTQFATAQLALTGVNLAGAEFGHHVALPGEYGTHYAYPTEAEVDYFMAKGMNVFRHRLPGSGCSGS